MKQHYEHEHTKRWSAIIDDADAFVFVTPEYDYFAPASLVNAIQCLAKEWNYKPAGIVSYGDISGGLRATTDVSGGSVLATIRSLGFAIAKSRCRTER